MKTQLFDAMQAGLVDVAMGGGRGHFFPEGVIADEETEGKRADGCNIVEEAKAAGVQYVRNDETASQLNLDGTQPILALFENSHVNYEHDRTGEPSLTEMTEAAISPLSNNESGFYPVVESGRVDHANHRPPRTPNTFSRPRSPFLPRRIRARTWRSMQRVRTPISSTAPSNRTTSFT